MSTVEELLAIWRNLKKSLEEGKAKANWERQVRAIFRIEEHEAIGEDYEALGEEHEALGPSWDEHGALVRNLSAKAKVTGVQCKASWVHLEAFRATARAEAAEAEAKEAWEWAHTFANKAREAEAKAKAQVVALDAQYSETLDETLKEAPESPVTRMFLRVECFSRHRFELCRTTPLCVHIE